MPLRLDIKRKLSSRSDRVKNVDIHPTEPWVLSAMYNGHAFLWNYSTQSLVKSFEVSDQPVRAAKFISRKQWIVAGADDMQIRVYNYNTMEKVKTFEAHSDYIRCMAVHASQPLLLTCSDDMTIKMWDWDRSWSCTHTYEGHSHYVMYVAFNPKDGNTFASASLDRTIKVWGIGNVQPHFTLDGHEKGVNCVDYFSGGDRPYLVSGADDKCVKVWDYQTKQCVQTMEGHANNIATVCCHPELPIIMSGSEDGTIKIWHATTYRLENTLNYAFERCWSIAALRGTNNVAIGYDEGTVAIQLGNEDPLASMDASGKIIIAKHNDVSLVNINDLNKLEGDKPGDGERLAIPSKELDVCEIYPQNLQHNSNGRFAVVTGDGEYIIYTALAWRKKSFGNCIDFVWALDSGEYAVRETPSSIKLFKNFAERRTFKPPFAADLLIGGALLCILAGEVCFFFDWADCRLVRRIDVEPTDVKWSDSGDLCVVVCAESFFILRYNRDGVQSFFESGQPVGEEGVEGAFDIIHEVSEQIRTCVWVGDCLLYTNSAGRLNYTIAAEVITLQHLDRPMYIVGYIKKDNRVYLIDRDYSIVSYQLLLSVIEYQTAVVRRDFDAAASFLPAVPREEYNRIARFLEAQGFREEALAVATDPEHQFELAIALGKLQAAYEYTIASPAEGKWKQLADLALLSSDTKLAEECLLRAADLPGLLLLFSSGGHGEGIDRLAELAKAKGKLNIAFICFFLRGHTEECLQLLLSAGRAPEAAFLARTYAPSRISEIVALWKESLQTVNPKAAESIADPVDYPNLFEGLEYALKAEEWLKTHRLQDAAASIFSEHVNDNESDLIEHMKLLEATAQMAVEEPAANVEPPPAAEAVEPMMVEVAAVTEAAGMVAGDEDDKFEEAQEASAEVVLADDLDAELDKVEPPPAAEDTHLDAELDAELDKVEPPPAGEDMDADLDAELDAELDG